MENEKEILDFRGINMLYQFLMAVCMLVIGISMFALSGYLKKRK